MFLAIDIGNTNIVFGLFNADELIGELRLQTDAELTACAYEAQLREKFAGKNFNCAAVQGIAMASVVPRLDEVLATICMRLFDRTPFIINAQTQSGITLCYDTPNTLGADRIVNAVAAYERFKSATIAIDMGTATTFDYVDGQGAYRGGAIAPGIVTSAEALFVKAAKLPRIELEYPERLIGRSTVECMQSGIVAGYACMVDGMIDRIRAEACSDARVIATGGLARLIARHTRNIEEVDDHLLLRGLKIMYDRRIT
jgi:type III pantothenate kinase